MIFLRTKSPLQRFFKTTVLLYRLAVFFYLLPFLVDLIDVVSINVYAVSNKV